MRFLHIVLYETEKQKYVKSRRQVGCSSAASRFVTRTDEYQWFRVTASRFGEMTYCLVFTTLVRNLITTIFSVLEYLIAERPRQKAEIYVEAGLVCMVTTEHSSSN